MRWLSLLLVLASTGCSSLAIRPGSSPAADCVTCEDGGDCPWWNPWCLGCRHPRYHTWIDTVITRKEARHLARYDLRRMDGACDSCDYQYGFEQAYVDVALGASGEVPPLPPARYWRSWNRTAAGHARANNWFAGYAAGAPRAISIYEPFNEVASSGAPGYELDAHSLAVQPFSPVEPQWTTPGIY